MKRPRRVLALLGTISLLAGACAPAAPPVLPGGARYPEFVFPDVPPDLAQTTAAVSRHERAWGFLQAGDLRTAARGFSDALRHAPGFYPAETGLGYVELAQQDFAGAVDRFDRALSFGGAYLPALLGRGEALLAWNRPEEALASFEAALRIDGTLTAVQQRVEVLRFRGAQEAVALAREATRAGRLGEAREAYARAITASPESGFLHRELAAVEHRLGETDRALGSARRALDLDPDDVPTLVLVGEIEEDRGNFDEALAAWERAWERDRDPEMGRRLETLRRRIEVSRLPPAYLAIPAAQAVTRGDLAALVGVRLRDVIERAPSRGTVVVTDARGHWASDWIASVTAARVIDEFPNHTFQPNAVVRRGDLAEALGRVLRLIASRDPEIGARWQGARPEVRDVGPGHLRYPAVAVTVGAGVLPLLEDGRFDLARVVSGADAVAAVERVEALLGR